MRISKERREEFEREFVNNIIHHPQAVDLIRIKPKMIKDEGNRKLVKYILECYKANNGILNVAWINEKHKDFDVDLFIDIFENTMSYNQDWQKQLALQQESILTIFKGDYIDDCNSKLKNGEITYDEFNQRIEKIKDIKINLEKDKVVLRVKDINIDSEEEKEKVKSNTTHLDKLIHGFTLGQLSVWSGSNGSGKSSYLNQIAIESMRQGYNVLIYSGELESKRLLNWIVQQCCGGNHMKYNSQKNYYYVGRDDKNTIKAWLDNRLFIYNNEYSMNAKSIIASIKDCVAQNNIKVVILDNLMSMNLNEYGKSSEKYDAQSLLVKELSALAKKLDIHIHFVCHPRKATTFLRKNDISGSADLTNIADNVFIVHRVTTDFINQTKEMFHWKPDDEVYNYSNIVEVCKNRDYGVQDKMVGMFYDEKSRQLLNTQDEDKTIL